MTSGRRIAKLILLIPFLMVGVLVIMAAYSHRILPAGIDACQRDATHAGHVHKLPAFHCAGHSEWDMQQDTWDHVHPWMTDEWQQEYFREHDNESME